jgi:CheY-like chemotaxis protein
MLVVEDDQGAALLINTILRHQGYQVIGNAVTGPRALELAAAERPDLVLMDITLAGEMDGIEAAKQIQERTSCPVVFLTAQTAPEVLERARAVEPYGYLVKPFDPRLLHPTIEMALHKHRMERERQELTERLQRALAEVEQLRGLLPVCAWCRRVRDDHGYWETLEKYVERHLHTQYTHGICQECYQKVEKTGRI